ncbi:alpha/beta hydrolase family protein [Sphingomonas sp. TX0543]|uniref:alpha/beta hydrolase family protein n=1 Tax=unclassified Sphingomonas TaxID=196159 RepID=UPI0010F94791|nr:S9 family peptidase [Sphingomonas sp. 3P27F8]
MNRLAFVAMLLATTPALAEPTREAKAFGAREYVADISLSPDGKKIAIVRPLGNRMSIATVAQFDGKQPQPVLKSSGEPERLRWCQWASTERLVCSVYGLAGDSGFLLGFTRLASVKDDGTGYKMITDQGGVRTLGPVQFGGDLIDLTADGKPGSVLMALGFVPEETVGTRLANQKEGLGVVAVDISSLSRRIVEQPKPRVVSYISDGVGKVRVMGSRPEAVDRYSGDTVNYFYRRADQKTWERLSSFKVDGSSGAGFQPIAVDPATNVVYGFDNASGRRALYRVSLDGNMTREMLVARPDVDVDELIRIGRQQRVVGASWVVEHREAEYFDPELKKLRVSLSRAIPKLPMIRFVDASSDEKLLLLHASSDNDPGRYFLYDKTNRHLEEVAASRPELSGFTLATVKPVSYRAADGTVIPAYLTLPPGSDGKNLPAIVLPHGGPAARDEWGFDWLAQFFAARGYAVLQPNFRGSAGYGQAWFEKNGFQSWRTAIGDVNDGGRWLQQQGIAAPGKLAIVGWSYGGYAALQSAVLDGDLFKAIVAIAPVTDLDSLREESRRFVNFVLVDRFIGNGPHIREGSPARNAAAIKAPVLMFHGDRDANVGIAESRLMATRLRDAGKKVELVEFKGLDHQLDDSSARAEMLDKADKFLRASLGL